MANLDTPKASREPPAPPAPPSAWQHRVGQRLAAALQQARAQHPPGGDQATPNPRPLASAWRLPRRQAPAALHALARRHGQARAGTLFARCLHHYRTQIRPGDSQAEAEDDAGVALACFLTACLQSLEGHTATPERWRAVNDWLAAWVAEELDWPAAPLVERQDFFERLASLAVAVGEWSVQASRQGPTAIASARLMAQSCLRMELGLDAAELVATMRWLGVVPATAADPSWEEAELPKAPTSRATRGGL